jgi:hypothetical protein
MRLLIATLMACLSLSALGQAPRPALTPDQVASIDTFVTQEMQHEQISGVAIGVYSRGRILLAAESIRLTRRFAPVRHLMPSSRFPR